MQTVQENSARAKTHKILLSLVGNPNITFKFQVYTIQNFS